MKIFILILTCICFLIITSSFRSDKINETVNYYYYQGEKFFLNPDNSGLFVSLKHRMSENDLSDQLGMYKNLFDTKKFVANENMQILNFNSEQSHESVLNIADALNSNPEFECVSPVFNAGRENNKSQIGYLNEIIVQFRSDMNADEVVNYIGDKNMQIVQKFDLSGGETYLLKISAGSDAMITANNIFESGISNYSEPNFFHTNILQYTPNDQYYPSQWSIRNIGNNIPGSVVGVVDCDMDVDSAWDISLGTSNVKVSIVDTGIDTLHPDLQNKILNGKGYNFYSNNSNSMDDYGHGTCCAGVVAAQGNNSIGVSGLAPNAKIFGVKITNSQGSTTGSVITNALIYVKNSGCWISSNSWILYGPSSSGNNAILDGITNGRGGKGIVYCAAAGNDDLSSLYWPASNPNVISVGALSPCNQRKNAASCDGSPGWASNYGTGLTIVAPGVKIYATDIRGATGFGTGDYVSSFNGTSSATPNAAGVCALILGLDSNMRWDTLRSRIARLAEKVGSYNYNQSGYLGLGQWNNEMGYGKINAFSVMQYTQNSFPVASSTIKLAEQGYYNANLNSLNIRDTVRILLRSTASPYAIVDSGKTVIDSVNLSGTLTFSNALSGTYYVVIRHRNALETWSKSGGQTYVRGTSFTFDFTASVSQAYGNNLILTGSKYCLYSGDIDGDYTIDAVDMIMVYNELVNFSGGYVSSDVNGDRFVDVSDLILVYNNSLNIISRQAPPGAGPSYPLPDTISDY